MAKPPVDVKKQQLKVAANKIATERDADLIVLNFELLVPIDFLFVEMATSRKPRTNVVLFLTTEGGSADAAYRMMRCLQARYTTVSVVVSGWCKSAGTLMCIGADELFIGLGGELGPLDVQIVKADEMDEQKSGLVAEAAFEKLQQEAYKFFMAFVRDMGSSEYRFTLRTASDIATRMTVGVVQPIFEKLDPVTIGEDYRSNRLAQAYAERLNVRSKNLVRRRDLDALENLLSSYPSHGFVIDEKEARTLFHKVKPVPSDLEVIVNLLSVDAKLPRNSRQGQGPRLEFLNDDPTKPAQSQQTASTTGPPRPGDKRSTTRVRKGTGKRPGDTAERSRQKSNFVTNGSKEAKT